MKHFVKIDRKVKVFGVLESQSDSSAGYFFQTAQVKRFGLFLSGKVNFYGERFWKLYKTLLRKIYARQLTEGTEKKQKSACYGEGFWGLFFGKQAVKVKDFGTGKCIFGDEKVKDFGGKKMRELKK